MKRLSLVAAGALLLGLSGHLYSAGVPTPDMKPPAKETVETPTWTFTFERGLPTKETVALMYNALDFQRAVEGYIWATPMVHFDEWRRQMKDQMGLDYGDVAYEINGSGNVR